MTSRLTIELFGSLRVLQGEAEVTRFRTQKTAVLLAYLACFAHRTHPREELIDLLWPEVDRESGRMSLRTALAALRRQLEISEEADDAFLVSDRLHVRLRPERVVTDVHQFELALRNSSRTASAEERARFLQAAIDLYRGPLLRGFYDDWILRERQRLETLFHGALQELARAQEAQGQHEIALQTALRWAEAEPLNEEAHLLLMRLYAAVGQIDGARRQLREWERLLREELGEDASEAGRALLQQLLRAGSAGAARRPVAAPAPLVTADVSQTPPAPVSVAPAPSASLHLPTLLTRFFGREEEIARIQERATVGQARLLTLTGPGGTGKTRLALEVAHRLAPHFHNAVWFVPLAEIVAADELPMALTKALALPLQPDTDPLSHVMERLAQQPSLLILDNFEQLVEEAGGLVADLLSRLPALTCIVTSRQRLDIGGEQEFALLPLPIPQPGRSDVLGQATQAGAADSSFSAGPDAFTALLAYPSVELFLDRARSARSDFQLTAANAEVVAALCIKLEGIPLAIELTAAWIQTLAPAQMLERLNRRFDLLTSRRKDLPARHRTLRATIEWSYRLLTPELQRQFARLSIFSGGWTLAAAEAVCQDTEPAPYLLAESGEATDILEACSLLAERSLILTEEAGEEMRYSLLESLREYAAEQLSEADRERRRARHRDYFVDLAEQAYNRLRGPEHRIWMERIEQDLNNLRAAMRRCLSLHEVEPGLRIAGALTEFWFGRGYAAEGRQWLEAFLAEPQEGVHPRTRARALTGLGTQLGILGHLEQALPFYEQGAQLYTDLQDRAGMADVFQRIYMPITFVQKKIPPGRVFLERSLALYREIEDINGVALVLCKLGSALRDEGDEVLADTYYQQAIALYRQMGDRNGLSVVLGELGYLRSQQGSYEEASLLLEENLTICREMQHKGNLMHGLWLLGRVREMQRDFEASRQFLLESVALGREIGARQGVSNALNNLAIVAELQHDWETAYGWFRQALETGREMNNLRVISYAQQDMALMKFRLRAYSEAEALALQSLETHVTGGLRRGVRTCLMILAHAAIRHALPARAAFLLGAMETAREFRSEEISEHDVEIVAGCIEAAQLALGEEAYSRLWQEGRDADFEAVIFFTLYA